MELGIYTFGELPPDAYAGNAAGAAQRMRDLIEEIELADRLGLDVFAVGEHHRADYLVSSPAVVLAAAAARTKRIRLSSAVSVISSDDPVRVFQDFATIDLISNGRAEIMAGRGSFIESFPLFGYDLHKYDQLFAEKLDLLLKVRDSVRVTWSGKTRAPIEDLPVYPRPIQDPLPVWIAVGGNAASAERAGLLGLPMAIAIIGGMPERFATFAEIHRAAAKHAGHDPLPALSINSHGYIAETAEAAIEESFAPFKSTMDRIGRERGWSPMSRHDLEASRTLRGANFIGSPQEAIDKILFQHEIFKHDRFLLQMTVGPIPHEKVMRSIELFATQVAPAVRAATRSSAT